MADFKNKILQLRYDTIVVWGSGLKHLEAIILDIQQNKDFEIQLIKKHKVCNFNKLLRVLYTDDHVPVCALKEKVKYLKKTSKNICFIVVRNLDSEWDYFGEGSRRIAQSLSIRKLKKFLRDRYNDIDDCTKNIMYATNNVFQTNNILKYLGYDGMEIFNTEEKVVNTPYHIDINNFTIENIDISDILLRPCDTSVFVGVKDSYQYQFLIGNEQPYVEYLEKYRGTKLCDNHNIKYFKKLINDFEYLKDEKSYIIVQKSEGKYRLLDGLHRLAICYYKGYDKVRVCVNEL